MVVTALQTPSTLDPRLVAQISHLDGASQRAFIAAGKSLRVTGSARVRVCYTPKDSKRDKLTVMTNVGQNEVVGVLVKCRFNKKTRAIFCMVMDEVHREVGKAGPVLTNLSLSRITNVVLL